MTILLSAGHSNTDPGAVAGDRRESDIVTEFRNIVASKLRAAGVEVVTDGDGRANLPLAQAIRLARSASLAVEFHCNASIHPAARGVECISLPDKRAVSKRISAAIAGVLGAPLRGEAGWIDQSKSARGKLGFVQAGGVIVELFFLSNPAELAAYEAKKWLVAQAVADVLKEA